MKIIEERGDSAKYEVTVYDEDGVIADITGYTATMTVRIGSIDGTVLFTKTGTITTPTSGIILFTILKTDMTTIGTNYYDVEITNGTDVHTVILPSIFQINNDVTRI